MSRVGNCCLDRSVCHWVSLKKCMLASYHHAGGGHIHDNVISVRAVVRVLGWCKCGAVFNVIA